MSVDVNPIAPAIVTDIEGITVAQEGDLSGRFACWVKDNRNVTALTLVAGLVVVVSLAIYFFRNVQSFKVKALEGSGAPEKIQTPQQAQLQRDYKIALDSMRVGLTGEFAVVVSSASAWCVYETDECNQEKFIEFVKFYKRLKALSSEHLIKKHEYKEDATPERKRELDGIRDNYHACLKGDYAPLLREMIRIGVLKRADQHVGEYIGAFYKLEVWSSFEDADYKISSGGVLADLEFRESVRLLDGKLLRLRNVSLENSDLALGSKSVFLQLERLVKQRSIASSEGERLFCKMVSLASEHNSRLSTWERAMDMVGVTQETITINTAYLKQQINGLEQELMITARKMIDEGLLTADVDLDLAFAEWRGDE